MNDYLILLKAMFRNKFRFATGSKRGTIAILCLFAFLYVFIMSFLLFIVIELQAIFASKNIGILFYFFVLLTASLVVLMFGIVSLVSTLYLSKDTDFYSVLPVKQTTVFAAKLSYVYISEAVIVAAIALPIIIAFGIVSHAWAWFYVISIATLIIVPALPLMFSAIIAIPVMFVASKLKNRSVVSLVFYMILFGGYFGAYMYFISLSSNADVLTGAAVTEALQRMQVMLYVFYPFTSLTTAALGIPMYGLNVGASTVVNLLIFLTVSAALVIILMFAGKFMYGQSVKANNQTNNSKSKKGEFRTSGSVKALIKREYISSLRTTQVAFQCYAVMMLPIIIAVVFGIMTRNNLNSVEELAGVGLNYRIITLVSFCTLAAMFATLGNAAATTFSREGAAIASLKILPISGKRVLMSKVAAWIIPASVVAVVSVVILNAFSFDITYFVLSLFSLVPLTAEFVLFGALWDIRSPKLKWTDPLQAVKHNGNVVAGQLLCMVGGLLAVLLLVILMVNSISFDNIFTICWCVLYGLLAIFGVIDILLYRKIDTYFNRIEI